MKRNRIVTFGRLLDIGSYRIPMAVTEGVLFSDGVYYRCPRCRRTVEREYMAFCDRCGQKLGWRKFKKAKISTPGRANN